MPVKQTFKCGITRRFVLTGGSSGSFGYIGIPGSTTARPLQRKLIIPLVITCQLFIFPQGYRI